jgi:hypothetical protein
VHRWAFALKLRNYISVCDSSRGRLCVRACVCVCVCMCLDMQCVFAYLCVDPLSSCTGVCDYVCVDILYKSVLLLEHGCVV